MQTIDKLREMFVRIFEEDIDVEKVSEDTRFIEDLGMTSISMLYMALAIEEEFGIAFNNDDFTTLRSVGDVLARIEKG
ncbi:MAG: acyl carrier protein [Ruminococcaceae bacterium]|nr:acyl carrier protein [Oscillospiraceae bacterium]MBQ2781549.1 hypothetical protein [Clostridia bacterium]MBQ7302058.1 hypothetical protein [Clostridia bacterium]